MEEEKRFNIIEVVNIIEGTGHSKLDEAIVMLEKALTNISPEDFEKRGQYYYYLLRAMLAKHIPFENPLAANYFQRMTQNLQEQEKAFKNEMKNSNEPRKRSLVRSQLKAFYKLVQNYYSTLESIYTNMGFTEAKERAYEHKMGFRMSNSYLEEKYLKYLGYMFYNITSRFGLSFVRLGVTVLVLIILFSLLYFVIDLNTFPKIVNHVAGFSFDYIYFSVSTFTTLGTGDYLPINFIQKFLVSIEVISGYVMLGLFLNLVVKRL